METRYLTKVGGAERPGSGTGRRAGAKEKCTSSTAVRLGKVPDLQLHEVLINTA